MNRSRILLCALLFIQSLLGCGAEPAPSQLAEKVAATRYPIVLHHGLLGFDRILFVDYFYEVKRTLESQGHFVRATRVSTVAPIEVRARQLAGQIDQLLAETGAPKVNIIAHSMGGLDARHLISVLGYGDRVGALITIGTPHRGTPVADLAYSVVTTDGGRLAEAVRRLFVGDDAHRTAQKARGGFDLEGAVWSLSEQHLRSDEFVAAHRDDPRVVYESFAGHSSLTGFGEADAIHPMLAATFAYLKLAAGDNDGLVPVESARYGLDRGTIPADHVNMIGQLFGETGRSFRHREFYASLAGNLAARGL